MVRQVAALIVLASLAGCAAPEPDPSTYAVAARVVRDGVPIAELQRWAASGLTNEQIETILIARENASTMGRAAGLWIQAHPGEALPPYLVPAQLGQPVSCVGSQLGYGVVAADCY